ncbi:hypothetical protein M3N64_12925 [Sporolactobacillus sp. CPB3-1]|uniref:YdhG-like domain-containing protein n=1 Tax=Sporolactobacillus mangiferae TaxID=2940498 RepID=A0ABT0MD81_9BACL|nr:hypothetical protein [Sporolactobacillus mangiferae]MCL1632823.1 hypothetical protein [Sporolactobacillus mangiferae]
METVTEFLNRLEYLNRFNAHQKLWLHTMIRLMRNQLPQWDETTFCRMPVYRLHHKYIAFNVTNHFFSFYSNDEFPINLLKQKLTSGQYGKCCVHVPLSDLSELPAFSAACQLFVSHSVNTIDSAEHARRLQNVQSVWQFGELRQETCRKTKNASEFN